MLRTQAVGLKPAAHTAGAVMLRFVMLQAIIVKQFDTSLGKLKRDHASNPFISSHVRDLRVAHLKLSAYREDMQVRAMHTRVRRTDMACRHAGVSTRRKTVRMHARMHSLIH